MPRGIKLRTTDSIATEVQAVDRQIRQRAFELSRAGGHARDSAVNWLQAEQDVSWRPAIELRRDHGAFVVLAAIAGVDPDDIEVAVAPDDVLVQAGTAHRHTDGHGEVHVCEFHRGPLFRSIHFPERIEPRQATVELKNGLLRITAPVAGTARVTPPASPKAASGKRRKTPAAP